MGQLSPRLPRGNISHRESQSLLLPQGARTLSSTTPLALWNSCSVCIITLGLQVSSKLKSCLCRSTMHRQEQVLYKMLRLLREAQLSSSQAEPLCASQCGSWAAGASSQLSPPCPWHTPGSHRPAPKETAATFPKVRARRNRINTSHWKNKTEPPPLTFAYGWVELAS